jgi:outer membrane lipoprotein-sorting protein
MQNRKSKFGISNVVVKVSFVLLGAVGTCWAGGCSENLAGSEQQKEVCTIETALKRLRKETCQLKSYQAQIEYLVSQPLFESKTLRKGVLYYQKTDKGSRLRINFQILRQDDEQEQPYVQEYVFDGVWLTQIDHQIKEVKRYQQAEPNKPVDVFELAGENFPIIGFGRIDELEKEFEMKLISEEQAEPSEFIKLLLKVRPDSAYKDDYTSVDFWIDERLNLPANVRAVSTEEDIYQVRLFDAVVNDEMDEKVFDIEIPEGFGEELIPLKKSKRRAD